MVRLLRASRGTAGVDFAMVGAAFMTLLLLVMEGAWQLAISGGLDHGARTAARWAATGQAAPSGSTREAEIKRRIAETSRLPIDAGRMTVQAESFASVATLPSANAATPGLGGPDTVVRYRVTYTAPALTPAGQALLPTGGMLHSFSVVVRNEPYVVR